MSIHLDHARVRVAIDRLRERAAEPICAYLYDLQALRRHASGMRDALPPGFELYYAAKANAEAPVLLALQGVVDGFEAASGGELNWLHRQLPGRPLLFGGPGKLDSELALAVSLPDCTIHVESLGELERLSRIAADSDRHVSVFLRMNIDVAGVGATRLMMGGRATPFGMDEQALPQALEYLRRAPHLHLEGFHFHLMSHQREVDVQLALVRCYVETVGRWNRTYGLDVRIVNAGGGFGVDYADAAQSFQWQRFCAGLWQLDRGGLTVRFEPGRYVAAGCGYYVMEVLDIKRSHGEYFAIARGGTHHFRTPVAQGHDHPFFVMRGGGEAVIARERVTLVGQLCTPKDVLARGQWVEALACGDCLVFPLAGAYAWNISHQNFLMHAPPEMVFLGS
jgi:diaminopimelate decarboxylase